MRSRIVVRIVSLGLGAALLGAVGCTGKDPYAPGSALGTFAVDAALTSTTCGPAPDPYRFEVRLAHEDGARLFWIQGGAPVDGAIERATMTASLVARTEETLRPADARSGAPGCVLTREDVLSVVLADDAGAVVTDPADTTAFRGTLTYRFAPRAESADCADQLTSAGGGYEALPCAVTYAVTATRTKAPPRTTPTPTTTAAHLGSDALTY